MGDGPLSRLLADPPLWTDEALHRERDRRLAEDLRRLGPRPGWWHPIARRLHDQETRWFQKAHANDLRTMLATRDPRQRAVTGLLIGWTSLEDH